MERRKLRKSMEAAKAWCSKETATRAGLVGSLRLLVRVAEDVNPRDVASKLVDVRESPGA